LWTSVEANVDSLKGDPLRLNLLLSQLERRRCNECGVANLQSGYFNCLPRDAGSKSYPRVIRGLVGMDPRIRMTGNLALLDAVLVPGLGCSDG
jgi:hypothetical protein